VAVAVLTAVFLGARGENAAAFELMHASGALSLSNSSADAAILDGRNLRPGVPVTGTVTIGNTGSGDAALAIQATADANTPGTGGGSLWNALQLTISDGATVVYQGSVAGLGQHALGTLNRGAARTYVFTAWLPNGNDNAFQGARLSLGFTWLAEATGAGEDPVPTATPTPTAPVTTTPPAPTAPAPTVTAAAPFAWPKTCARNTLTLTLRPGVTVKSVTVNGKKAHLTRKGIKLTLSKLPKGKLKIQVKAALGGRTLTPAKTYKSCAAR
jgi:hypothetical protein